MERFPEQSPVDFEGGDEGGVDPDLHRELHRGTLDKLGTLGGNTSDGGELFDATNSEELIRVLDGEGIKPFGGDGVEQEGETFTEEDIRKARREIDEVSAHSRGYTKRRLNGDPFRR
jgi:hypothetical protein